MANRFETADQRPIALEFPKDSFLYDFLIEKGGRGDILKKIKSAGNDQYVPPEVLALLKGKAFAVGRGPEEKLSPVEFGLESARRLNFRKE